MQLIVVSGRSGSGKTVALRVLEDLGYYCVDNLPVNLLPQLIVSVESQYDKLAVSIDVRNLPTQPDKLDNLLTQVRNEGRVEFSSFFFDADNGTLLKRYGESRRLHPCLASSCRWMRRFGKRPTCWRPSPRPPICASIPPTSAFTTSASSSRPGCSARKRTSWCWCSSRSASNTASPRMRTSCSMPVSCPTPLDPGAQAVYRSG